MAKTPLQTIALIAALFLFAGGAHAADGGWPFGAVKGKGRYGGAGGDYYNLGLLGAKAEADDRAAPDLQGPSGGRRRGRAPRPTHDRGPDRLRVTVLFPDGPAARAGLAVGDVIVGVGRSPFKEGEGSLGPIAEGLVKAEAGKKKGVLTLLVDRAGKHERLAVSIPQGGKEAAKPLKGKAQQAIVDKSLRWLADQQASGGGYKQTLSGANGAVVMASLAGLAWLAGGSDLEQGPYKTNVQKAADFVIAGMGAKGRMGGGRPGGSNWDQTNWGLAHGAIFLGELNARTPKRKLKAALEHAGEELAKRQEASGGWAHGPGGPNALGYLELNIVSGLALCGLGMARQAGYEVPEETLDKAEQYLRDSSGGGGVGYSSNKGQKGQGNIGRTAICWLGFVTLGLGGSDWAKKMEKWATRNSGDVLGGHASLMEHILHAGVAAHALGKKAKSAYWSAMARDLTLARAPDGSFQPRPWHESLGMGSNSDVTFGQVWTTAAWTIVLACEPGAGEGLAGLPAWMGVSK